MDSYSFKDENPEVILFKHENFRQLKSCLIGNTFIFDNGGYMNRGTHARLVRATICKKNLFNTELKIREDASWGLDLLTKCESVCVVKKVWYLYRKNFDSKLHGYNENVITEYEMTHRVFQKYVNLSIEEELCWFCDMLIQDLRIVAETFLLNKKCRLSRAEKKRIINNIYTQKPWAYLNSKTYFKHANKKRKIVCLLFRLKILFGTMKLLGL